MLTIWISSDNGPLLTSQMWELEGNAQAYNPFYGHHLNSKICLLTQYITYMLIYSTSQCQLCA